MPICTNKELGMTQRSKLMKCNEVEVLLLNYLEKDLEPSRALVLEEHLAECAACREQVSLWNGMAELQDERPDPRVHERFARMLTGNEYPALHSTSVKPAAESV